MRMYHATPFAAIGTALCLVSCATLSVGAAPSLQDSPPPRYAVDNGISASSELADAYLRYENRAYILKSAIWETRRIPICWDQADIAATKEARWVREAVKREWFAKSSLSTTDWVTCATTATGIRIWVGEEGPHTNGLGTQIKGPKGMVLNFTFSMWGRECAQSEEKRKLCIESIAVHEFGHALGFAHEQNRPDTPGECTERPQGPDGNFSLSPWDEKSALNYCNSVYNNDGVLSEKDVEMLQYLYGKPSR